MKIHTLLVLAIAQTFAIAQPALEAPPSKSITPAERLAEDWWKTRWEAKLTATKAATGTELVFLGDSITQGWEGGGKKTWDEHFAKYKPLNLGFSGDRTEHLLWRIRTDETNLRLLKPKVAVILIGTNNTGHEMRPAADTTAGIKAVLDELKSVWPDTKFLVLSVFPRGENAEDPKRKLNDEINALVAKLSDGKTIFVQDISSSFLAADGTLPKEVMPDKLHLSGQGYELWAKAIAPKLAELGL